MFNYVKHKLCSISALCYLKTCIIFKSSRSTKSWEKNEAHCCKVLLDLYLNYKETCTNRCSIRRPKIWHNMAYHRIWDSLINFIWHDNVRFTLNCSGIQNNFCFYSLLLANYWQCTTFIVCYSNCSVFE